MFIDPIATHARSKPKSLACVDLETGRRWDWRALDEAANRIANFLVGEFGPASGARVATLAAASGRGRFLCPSTGAWHRPKLPG
jgi:acyl-CoA synthetase (AMP-forming)/AMP-acid ligase II